MTKIFSMSKNSVDTNYKQTIILIKNNKKSTQKQSVSSVEKEKFHEDCKHSLYIPKINCLLKGTQVPTLKPKLVCIETTKYEKMKKLLSYVIKICQNTVSIAKFVNRISRAIHSPA